MQRRFLSIFLLLLPIWTKAEELQNRTVCQSFPVNVPPKLSLSFNNVILANKTYMKNGEYDEDNEKGTYVEEGKEINVTCLAEGAKPFANLTWTLNGEKYDDVEFTRNTSKKENRTFDSQSTLRFVANGTNITVTCKSSLQGTEIQTLISATFLTYVKPKLYLEVNGIEVLSKIYVKESAEVNITCHAIGARPVPQINWMKYHTNYSQLQENKIMKATFDVTSTLMFNASKNEEEFVCRTTIYEVNITDEITLMLASYVLPEPILTVDDNSSEVIYIEQEEKVTITCDASGAKPRAELSWVINGYPVDETIFKISRPSAVFSTLILQPRQNDTVKCTIFLPGPNETKMDSITFYVKVRNEEQSGDGRFDNLIIWVVLSLVAAFMTVLVCCVGSATRRVKASKSSDLSASHQLSNTHNDRTVNGLSMTSRGLPAIREPNAEGNKPRTPNLPLPKIPCSENSYYYDISEQQHDYEVQLYSEYLSKESYNYATSKLFSEKDICFILKMKMGHIYNRWMGTITVSKEVTKCIILSTGTDTVMRKRELQWDKFVRKAITLPEATNLIKVQGIGINKGKLYLIHDFITGETLDEFISIPSYPSQVIGYVLGILDGMKVIQSYGLLHPGLSTKKILRTPQGICKLYDFCLSDDASNVVKKKTSQMTCSANQFAPETLLRNNYNMASDVWSVAVVIWEIMSCGTPPFSGEQQFNCNDKVSFTLPDKWPEKYNALRCERLFGCWNYDPSLRPSICQLQLSFMEIFESLDTYTTSDGDFYVPMKENEN